MSSPWSGVRRLAGLCVVLALLLTAGTGCGDDDASERSEAAAAYASRVAGVTESTRQSLAKTGEGADYRDAGNAARTTRDYAATIRRAADDLEAADPPAVVERAHGELVALYRSTAKQLDTLAGRFEAAATERELTARAQELSEQVQTYSTREAQLRSEIDRRLAGETPGTSPTTP